MADGPVSPGLSCGQDAAVSFRRPTVLRPIFSGGPGSGIPPAAAPSFRGVLDKLGGISIGLAQNSRCAWRAARDSNPGRHAGAACADASGSAHMGRPRPTESGTAYKIVTAQPLRSISGWSCLLPGDGYPAPRAIKRGRSNCRGARERAKGKSGAREPGFEPGFRRRERAASASRTWQGLPLAAASAERG